MTSYSLSKLKQIVFEGKKVPHYTRRHKKTTISTVLDKEGLHTVIFGSAVDFSHSLKDWKDITEEDVSLLVKKLEEKGA